MKTDFAFKVFALIVLTPLLGLIWQVVLSLGGASVLSDLDIARFFIGPFGWCSAIVLGSVWLGIFALEQVSLLYIFAANQSQKTVSSTVSISWALNRWIEVLLVSVRMLGWTLLVIAPFLVALGITYYWFLGEYDINYYLTEWPFEFKIAIGIAILLFTAPVAVLARTYSGWAVALPLVVFENLSAREALSTSVKILNRKRRVVFVGFAMGLVLIVLCNFAITMVIGGLGRILIPDSVGSIVALTTRIGLMLLVFATANLVLNMLATIAFAAGLFCAYEKFSPGSADSIGQIFVENTTASIPDKFNITSTGLVATGLIGLIVAASSGWFLLDSFEFEDNGDVMAHRGSSAIAPENTMSAFRQAIADGAHWIEIDVQETADGEVVVFHDSDFMKSAGNPLKIWEATMDGIQNIDIGSWKDPKFAAERVPTLREVLELCRDRVGVIIELKYYGHDQQLEQRVIDIVENAAMTNQVMVMSLKNEGVKKVKALRPNWTCGLLLSVYVGKLGSIDADFLAVNSRLVTGSFVRRAHKAGKKVFVWTVNDVANMSRALNRNVDGILTDHPALLVQVLKHRSESSSAERLLAELATLFDAPQNSPEP